MADLEMVYLRDYFKTVYNRNIEDFGQPIESLLRSLGIIAANGEVTRAGIMFFGKNPGEYERSFMVKAVVFDGTSIGDTTYIDSRDISGTIPWMFRESMTFLKSVLRHQQQGQNFNKVGILEIPEVVLEELLQNAFVHIDLLHAAAIRLLVFIDRIEIINPGCLFGGLQVEDIKLGVSRQRNPLMASLAGKTMIYRGLGSGIIRVMKEDVQVEFVNEESANQFKTIIWRTTQKNESTTQKNSKEFLKEDEEFRKGDGEFLKEGENTIRKNESTIQKNSKEFLKEDEDFRKEFLKAKEIIYSMILSKPETTTGDMAAKIGVSDRQVRKYIKKLTDLGLLKREGGRKHGHWIVTDKDN